MTTSVFAYGINECASSRFGGDLGCTAADVSITGIAVAPGSPTKCVGGDTYTVDLDITINFHTPDRWDVGIFLSEDGNDPQIIPANGGANSCSVGILPTPSIDPTSPFLDLDPIGGLDTCGDGNGSINGNTGSGVVRMSNVPVACKATNLSKGNLFIPFVVTWDNQASPSGDTCTSIADPLPNTTSKCNAPDGTVEAEVKYGTIGTIVLPDITKDDGVSTVVAGNSTTYSVVITNSTGAGISGALFKDPAVADLTVNSLNCAATGGASCPASLLIPAMQGGGILLPDMPAGSTLTFTVDAAINAGATAGTITNTAYVSFRGETNEASDTNNVTTKLSSSKAFTPASINVGETTVLSVTLINNNLNDATNVAFTDNYPADLVNTGTPDLSNTCGGTASAAADGASLTLTGGTLAAGASCTVSVNVTSTTGGAYLNNTGPISSDQYDGDPATANLAIGVSSLETSTKTWQDLNGGEADPGDVLRYIITLTETAGVPATGVEVTDIIPPTLSGATVTTCPTGATCNISAGTLTASNVNVPANSSVTIVFEATIPAGLAAATAINNCVDITNLTGVGASTCAATITVSPSQVAITGNKWLYLGETTTDTILSRTPPTTASAVTIADGDFNLWNLSPSLALPVTISPLVTPLAIIPVNLYLASDVADETRHANVTVACSGGGTTYSQELIFDGTALNNPYLSTTPGLVLFNNLPFSAEQTCAAGDTWTLTVENTTPGKNSGDIVVYPVYGGNNSYFSIPSLSVINVDSVDTYDAVYPATTTPASGYYESGETVYIRAVISDPFGSYDISSATVTVEDANGTDIGTIPMVEVPGTATNSTKTFEYEYLVPAGATAGSWTTIVTAHEGTEGVVADSGTGSFTISVLEPDLVVMKSATTLWDPVNLGANPKSIPGGIKIYSITTTNLGPGAAEEVVITDPIPSDTTLYVGDLGQGSPVFFTDGAISSGYTASDVSVLYSSISDCTNFTFDPAAAPSSTDVDGFNPDVCRIKVVMSSANNLAADADLTDAVGPSFRIDFRVRIN